MPVRGALSFLNSTHFHQRAHPSVDGVGRGVGAFIFDKVHLQVPHRDAFSCTHPTSAGAGEKSLSTSRAHVIATCADLAEGVRRKRAWLFYCRWRKILKSACNSLGLARSGEIYSYEEGGWRRVHLPYWLRGLPRRCRWSAKKEKVKVRRILCHARSAARRGISISHPSIPPSSVAATVEISQEKINHSISRIKPQLKLCRGLRGWKMNWTADDLPVLGGCCPVLPQEQCIIWNT